MANSLTRENDRYIKRAVASGAYRSEAAALEQAAGLLKKRDQLLTDVAAGIEQADRGEPVPAEVVFERLEMRAREIEAAAKPGQCDLYSLHWRWPVSKAIGTRLTE
jgi:Arc/MetJ-type ribon-helix-helix transcriptional regulator